MTDSDRGRGYQPAKWTAKDFVQVAGLAIATGILSMYVTQKVVLQKIEDMKARSELEKEHLIFMLDSQRSRHELDCRELRRRINNLEMRAGLSGPMLGEEDNG